MTLPSHPSNAPLTRLSPSWSVWAAAWTCAGAWAWWMPAYAPATGGTWSAVLWTVFALAFASHASAARSYLRRLAVAVAVFVACGVLDLLLQRMEAQLQPQPQAFAWLAAGALKAAGEQATVQSGELLVENYQGLFRFAPTLAGLGARAFFVFLFAAGLLHVQRQGAPRARTSLQVGALATLVCGLGFAYRVLVFVTTDEVLADREHPGLARFLAPEPLLATIALLALVLWLAGFVKDVERSTAPLRLAPLALLGLTGLALGAGWAWSEPGRQSSGRVLIDDSLSGAWEPAGRLLTPDRYGDFSAYSFAVMTEHLGRRFAVDVHGQGPYTPELLADYDVLVIKTPYTPLSENEDLAILDWVRRGGGLFAIGDHTDLGGMSTVLNRLIEPAGMRFRFDATGSMASGTFDLWQPPLVPEHPISTGLGPIEFMTGCSIELSGRAHAVLTVDQSASTAGDYSTGSHFGNRAADGSGPQGLLVLAAASDLGLGRVVAFADSTVLSSFGYCIDSRADFTARSVAWLAREPTPARWLGLLWTLLAGVAALLTWRARPRAAESGLGAGALAVGLLGGMVVTGWLSGWALRSPSPRPGSTVAIGMVADGGVAWFPPVLGSQPELPDGGNLSSFAQLPLRLGYETKVVQRDPRALEGLQGLVLLNPDIDSQEGEASEEWVEAVRSWVDGGGRMLLVRRAQHLGHTHDRSDSYVAGLSFEPAASSSPDLIVEVAYSGRGRVVRLTGSEFLDVKQLGHCMDYPSDAQRLRHEAVLEVFGDLMGLPEPERQVFMPPDTRLALDDR